MNPTAFIYGEYPHRELSILEVPLWSFNDPDNVHEILNQKQMAEEIVATCGSLNNHLIYSQEDYPGIINDASKITPVAKVTCIKYDEETKTFIANITSTNQIFIDVIAVTEYFPRCHPCYEAETQQVDSNNGETNLKWSASTPLRTRSNFKRLLCWLVEPIKNMTSLSIEYRPVETETPDESENANNDVIHPSPRVPTADEIPLPKDEIYNTILKNIQPILDNSISDDGEHKWTWTYESCVNSFYWRINTPKAILQIGASLVFNVESKRWAWEIHTHNTSNVNVRVYANEINIRDESCSDYDDFSIDFMRKIRDDLAERLNVHNQKYRNESKSDSDNEKDDHWETMRKGINATLNSFCDNIIRNSLTGGSYKCEGSFRRITLGDKTIDIILQFDTNLDSWIIFIGDPTRPRILIDTNGDITADIASFIPQPLCFKDMQTLLDMLGARRNNNWQVKQSKRKEQTESCEASELDAIMNEFKTLAEKDQIAIITGHQRNKETSDDNEEEVSKLIPKEELMKIIFKNIKDVLKLNLSENKHARIYQMNSWSLSVRSDDSFRYDIYDRQKYVRKTIGCSFHKDHWDIFIDKYSNVNIMVHPEEALWVVDALVLGQHGDFPKEVLENIIKDINTWIKTKDVPNKEELPAFSQALIKDGKRPSKIDYYLAMAEVASTRGTCLRRRYGSVIVKDDRIVSTGYAGAPSGRQNCCDIGYCRREKLNAQRGTMYHLCRSVHSEQNAIINASKEEMLGATLYLAGVNIADGSIVKNADCCSMCKRFIINSGISRVIIKDPEKPEGYRVIDVSEWVSNDDSLDVEVGY